MRRRPAAFAPVLVAPEIDLAPAMSRLASDGAAALPCLSERTVAQLGAAACECRFEPRAERFGSGTRDAREIASAPGDLILMRAPGFRGPRARPFHAVDHIDAPRITLGRRQDARRAA